MYADDIVLYSTHSNPNVALKNLQSDLDVLVEECTSKGLTINSNKTKFVWYCARNQLHRVPDLVPIISGKPITRVQSYMYLGAILDSALTFEEYAKAMRDACNFLCFKLGKVRCSVSTATAITIFKQTILPKFDYCSYLLDCATQKWQTKIGRIQNRCLRICLHRQIKGNAVVKLHVDATTPLPPLRRKELLVSKFFSRAKKLHPDPHPRTRSSYFPTFALRRPKTEFYKKSPFYRGAMGWNALPSALQICDNKTSFKLQLKHHMGTYIKKPAGRKKKKKV